jgi:hypothetical protein
MMQVVPFNQDVTSWNDVVNASRNGAFMFNRGFMDYHAHRFTDYSLVIQKNETIVALLPANRDGNTVVTHGGLTFGGLILSKKTGASDVVEMFSLLKTYLLADGVEKVIYKPVPHIYHRIPCEEDLYALHTLGAKPSRVDVSTTIKRSARLPLSKGRKCALSKARKSGVMVAKSEDYAAFWAMLTQNLSQQHDVKPTHSLAEIELLASRFDEIQLYMAYIDDEAVAGVVMFDFGTVAHTQYIGLTDKARETGALDSLLEHLITAEYQQSDYFSFGISTCNNGAYFNEGLAAQKEMFGGRTTILQWLEWDLK